MYDRTRINEENVADILISGVCLVKQQVLRQRRGFLLTFFVLLVMVFPILTFFSDQRNKASADPVPTRNVKVPASNESNYFILDSHLSEDIPVNKPIYDRYTLQERLQENLPVGLPSFEYSYSEKIVYLTFDDGPNPSVTSNILETLKKNNVQATFFVVGSQAEKYPQLLKRIMNEGHAIGNHTYSHIYSQIYQSNLSYLAELEHNDQILKNILGLRPIISRAPGGSSSFTPDYWNLTREKGYVTIDWNIDSGDAKGASAKQMVQQIEKQLKNNNLWSHCIVLMHDGIGHHETAKALPEVIRLFRQRGFEFRCITPSTPPAW